MKQVEDLAAALVNLNAIEKCSSEKDSALVIMVHEIKESLIKKSDTDVKELARLVEILENSMDKDAR